MKFSLDVYVIVDLGFARGRNLEEVVNATILGGATIIQLRLQPRLTPGNRLGRKLSD